MRVPLRLFAIVALAVAIGLATGVSPFASPSPGGLETVAERKGFLDEGRQAGVQDDAPVPDYAFPGVGDPRLATGLAGFAGTLLVCAAGWGAARVVVRRAPRAEPRG